jgi:hypothetical protein
LTLTIYLYNFASTMYKLVRIYVATENENHMLLCCLCLNKKVNKTENGETYINLVPSCHQNGLVWILTYSRACGFCHDFLGRWLLPTRKLLNQGFLVVKLKSSFRKFTVSTMNWLTWPNISMSVMTIDMFRSLQSQLWCSIVIICRLESLMTC